MLLLGGGHPNGLMWRPGKRYGKTLAAVLWSPYGSGTKHIPNDALELKLLESTRFTACVSGTPSVVPWPLLKRKNKRAHLGHPEQSWLPVVKSCFAGGSVPSRPQAMWPTSSETAKKASAACPPLHPLTNHDSTSTGANTFHCSNILGFSPSDPTS